MSKLITILGPTASGKSTLGIKLAQEFNGEIVSADSRQVYRGLDIGSGKVTPEEQNLVPHHLLDIVDQMQDFSLAHYQKLAFEAIDDIIKRDKLPFLVGGTALYIYSVVDNYNLSDVGANPKRRKELEKLSVDELIVIASEALAKRSNPNNAPKSDDKIASVSLAELGFPRNDIKNPRRLIRAIEKLEAGASLSSDKNPPRYDALLLGTDVPREELYKKIDQRVDERIQPADSAGKGMIEEVENLRRQNISDEWLIGLGLEYRYITKYLQYNCQPKAGQPLAEITEYLQGKYTKDEMIKRLKGAIHAFARRQITWFKRDKRIIWIKNLDEARQQIKNFLE